MESQAMEVNTVVDYLILAFFEALGTAILTIGMNFGYKVSPDTVSAGLFVGILLTKRITACHLNAGITVAVAIVEKRLLGAKKAKIIAAYLLGQIAGSFIGMWIAYIVLGHDASMDLSPTAIKVDNVFYVLIIEFFFSWIFLTIYLHAKVDWVAPSQDFGLRAFTMMACMYAVTAMNQKIGGGALNPTIGFVAPLFRLIVRHPETDPNNARFMVSYIFGPQITKCINYHTHKFRLQLVVHVSVRKTLSSKIFYSYYYNQIGPLLAGALAGAFIRYFAIKVTPPGPEHSGSPFLAPKMRKDINDSNSSMRNSDITAAHQFLKDRDGTYAEGQDRRTSS